MVIQRLEEVPYERQSRPDILVEEKNIYLPHPQIWKDPGSKCCTMHTLVIWIGSAYLSGTIGQILKKVSFRLYEKK